MSAVIPLPTAGRDPDAPIPEGEYLLTYTRHDVKRMYGRGKLFIHFRIVDGEYMGTRLYRAYNVEMRGKRSFTAARSSDLYREFCHLTGARERRDRLGINRMKDAIIRGRVRTVMTDHRHKNLPPYLHYSVISELVQLEAGNMA